LVRYILSPSEIVNEFFGESTQGTMIDFQQVEGLLISTFSIKAQAQAQGLSQAKVEALCLQSKSFANPSTSPYVAGHIAR